MPGRRAETIRSQTRLVAPITQIGLTALSEEIIRRLRTFWRRAARTRFQVPRMLLRTASRDVRFHHRHVLVRGGVEDGFHRLPLHHLGQPVGLADIAERGHQLQPGILFAEFALDPEQIAFRLIERDQARRLEAGHLAA